MSYKEQWTQIYVGVFDTYELSTQHLSLQNYYLTTFHYNSTPGLTL